MLKLLWNHSFKIGISSQFENFWMGGELLFYHFLYPRLLPDLLLDLYFFIKKKCLRLFSPVVLFQHPHAGSEGRDTWHTLRDVPRALHQRSDAPVRPRQKVSLITPVRLKTTTTTCLCVPNIIISLRFSFLLSVLSVCFFLFKKKYCPVKNIINYFCIIRFFFKYFICYEPVFVLWFLNADKYKLVMFRAIGYSVNFVCFCYHCIFCFFVTVLFICWILFFCEHSGPIKPADVVLNNFKKEFSTGYVSFTTKILWNLNIHYIVFLAFPKLHISGGCVKGSDD